MNIRKPVPTIYGDFKTRYDKIWADQIKALKNKFEKKIKNVLMPGKAAVEVPVIYVQLDTVLSLLKYLKEEKGFEYNFLSDLTATDEKPRTPRFDVVYNLFSHSSFSRIRIKVKLAEDNEMVSIIPLWTGANWAEREVYDMFGIKFKDHPDMRRILLDVRWKGHPLRKDYPIKGYQVFATPEAVEEHLLK